MSDDDESDDVNIEKENKVNPPSPTSVFRSTVFNLKCLKPYKTKQKSIKSYFKVRKKLLKSQKKMLISTIKIC